MPLRICTIPALLITLIDVSTPAHVAVDNFISQYATLADGIGELERGIEREVKVVAARAEGARRLAVYCLYRAKKITGNSSAAARKTGVAYPAAIAYENDPPLVTDFASLSTHPSIACSAPSAPPPILCPHEGWPSFGSEANRKYLLTLLSAQRARRDLVRRELLLNVDGPLFFPIPLSEQGRFRAWAADSGVLQRAVQAAETEERWDDLVRRVARRYRLQDSALVERLIAHSNSFPVSTPSLDAKLAASGDLSAEIRAELEAERLRWRAVEGLEEQLHLAASLHIPCHSMHELGDEWMTERRYVFQAKTGSQPKRRSRTGTFLPALPPYLSAWSFEWVSPLAPLLSFDLSSLSSRPRAGDALEKAGAADPLVNEHRAANPARFKLAMYWAAGLKTRYLRWALPVESRFSFRALVVADPEAGDASDDEFMLDNDGSTRPQDRDESARLAISDGQPREARTSLPPSTGSAALTEAAVSNPSDPRDSSSVSPSGSDSTSAAAQTSIQMQPALSHGLAPSSPSHAGALPRPPFPPSSRAQPACNLSDTAVNRKRYRSASLDSSSSASSDPAISTSASSARTRTRETEHRCKVKAGKRRAISPFAPAAPPSVSAQVTLAGLTVVAKARSGRKRAPKEQSIAEPPSQRRKRSPSIADSAPAADLAASRATTAPELALTLTAILPHTAAMAHHIQASLLPLLVAEAPDVVATLRESGSIAATCTASPDALDLVIQALTGPPFLPPSVSTSTCPSTLSDISQRLSRMAAPRATLLRNADAAEITSRYATGHALSAYAATGEFLSTDVAAFVDGARLTAPLSNWLSGTLPLSALNRGQHSRHAIWEQVMWRLALLVNKKGTLEALHLIYPEHDFEAAAGDASHHSLPYPHIPLPLLSNADLPCGAPQRFILFSFPGHRGDPSTTGAATYRHLLLQYLLLHSHTGDHKFSYTLPFPLDACPFAKVNFGFSLAFAGRDVLFSRINFYHTTTDASFKPDISTRIADAEQRGVPSLNQNPHEPNSKPSAIDKVMGGVEKGIGKAIGDVELEKKGTVAQGKAYETQGKDYTTENGTHLGGEGAYSSA
ncbi:hypothetical protein JCM11641_003913 [Rhodosporidiobolus odoratus]